MYTYLYVWVYTYLGLALRSSCPEVTPRVELPVGSSLAHQSQFLFICFPDLGSGDSKYILKLKIQQKAVHAPCLCGEP